VNGTVLLYDADCGFCRWAVDKILTWDRQRRLTPVALHDPAADELLPGMDSETKMRSWHLVTPDGAVHSAGAGAAPLLRLLPGGRAPAALLSAFPGITGRAYALVARNRDLFGRLVGQSACDVDPSRRARK
jgi:predicted DCC family thiol-disulfide oxidoreductase YuxK